jgi:uncharacterized protein
MMKNIGTKWIRRPVIVNDQQYFQYHHTTEIRMTGEASTRFSQQQQQQKHGQKQRRQFSTGWQGHGTDLLSDSLAHNHGIPKIVLHGYSASGFDVINMVKNMDPNDPELKKTGGIVHMCGSILVLPSAAFLWNVRSTNELTVESICGPLQLYRPQLEYLFIGSPDGAGSIDPVVLDQIRRTLQGDQMKEQQSSRGGGATDSFTQNLVVEPMDLTNAMGTFNILNGEDRRVGAALILPITSDE